MIIYIIKFLILCVYLLELGTASIKEIKGKEVKVVQYNLHLYLKSEISWGPVPI